MLRRNREIQPEPITNIWLNEFGLRVDVYNGFTIAEPCDRDWSIYMRPVAQLGSSATEGAVELTLSVPTAR